MSLMTALGRFAADPGPPRPPKKPECSTRAPPCETKKNIGWPEAYRHNTVNKVVTGGWY